jgi:hypothetical protein
MRKLSMIIFTGLVAAFSLLPVFGGTATVSAAADAKSAICGGVGGSGGANCNVNGQPTVNGTIDNVVDIMSAIAGIAAVVMIIIAGFRFVTANGDSGTIASARRTVLYALVGLVVVGISQILVKFVLTDIL